MNIKLSKLANAAWKVFGKKAIGKVASVSAHKGIDQLCLKYEIKDLYSKELEEELDDIINYISSCLVEHKEIDKKKVYAQIDGPLATKLLNAASSVKNGQNFLSDIITKLDDSTFDDITKFMGMIEAKTGIDYVEKLRDVVKSVKEKNTISVETAADNSHHNEDSNKQSPKEAISITLQNERSNHTPSKNQEKKSDEDELVVNGIASDIQNALIEAKSKGLSLGAADVVGLTKLFIEKSAEVAKFCEEQKTKRTQIRAQTEVAIHQIDTLRDFLKDYMQKTFDERAKVFDKEFDVVDRCLATGDTAKLAVSLNAITDLAASSPFKALSDLGSVRNKLENKETFDI